MQTGTELASNPIRISCFKLTFRNEGSCHLSTDVRDQASWLTQMMLPKAQVIKNLIYLSQEFYSFNHR